MPTGACGRSPCPRPRRSRAALYSSSLVRRQPSSTSRPRLRCIPTSLWSQGCRPLRSALAFSPTNIMNQLLSKLEGPSEEHSSKVSTPKPSLVKTVLTEDVILDNILTELDVQDIVSLRQVSLHRLASFVYFLKFSHRSALSTIASRVKPSLGSASSTAPNTLSRPYRLPNATPSPTSLRSRQSDFSLVPSHSPSDGTSETKSPSAAGTSRPTGVCWKWHSSQAASTWSRPSRIARGRGSPSKSSRLTLGTRWGSRSRASTRGRKRIIYASSTWRSMEYRGLRLRMCGEIIGVNVTPIGAYSDCTPAYFPLIFPKIRHQRHPS